MRMIYPTSHRCICGCGELVSRKGCRTSHCHALYVNAMRTPEQQKRIGQAASRAASVARTKTASLPQTTWSATSNLV